MSLLFNMLSRFVIAFLSRSKHLLISWLQSPSAVILDPKKIKPVTVSSFSLSIFSFPTISGRISFSSWRNPPPFMFPPARPLCSHQDPPACPPCSRPSHALLLSEHHKNTCTSGPLCLLSSPPAVTFPSEIHVVQSSVTCFSKRPLWPWKYTLPPQDSGLLNALTLPYLLP